MGNGYLWPLTLRNKRLSSMGSEDAFDFLLRQNANTRKWPRATPPSAKKDSLHVAI